MRLLRALLAPPAESLWPPLPAQSSGPAAACCCSRWPIVCWPQLAPFELAISAARSIGFGFDSGSLVRCHSFAAQWAFWIRFSSCESELTCRLVTLIARFCRERGQQPRQSHQEGASHLDFVLLLFRFALFSLLFAI